MNKKLFTGLMTTSMVFALSSVAVAHATTISSGSQVPPSAVANQPADLDHAGQPANNNGENADLAHLPSNKSGIVSLLPATTENPGESTIDLSKLKYAKVSGFMTNIISGTNTTVGSTNGYSIIGGYGRNNTGLKAGQTVIVNGKQYSTAGIPVALTKEDIQHITSDPQNRLFLVPTTIEIVPVNPDEITFNNNHVTQIPGSKPIKFKTMRLVAKFTDDNNNTFYAYTLASIHNVTAPWGSWENADPTTTNLNPALVNHTAWLNDENKIAFVGNSPYDDPNKLRVAVGNDSVVSTSSAVINEGLAFFGGWSLDDVMNIDGAKFTFYLPASPVQNPDKAEIKLKKSELEVDAKNVATLDEMLKSNVASALKVDGTPAALAENNLFNTSLPRENDGTYTYTVLDEQTNEVVADPANILPGHTYRVIYTLMRKALTNPLDTYFYPITAEATITYKANQPKDQSTLPSDQNGDTTSSNSNNGTHSDSSQKSSVKPLPVHSNSKNASMAKLPSTGDPISLGTAAIAALGGFTAIFAAKRKNK